MDGPSMSSNPEHPPQAGAEQSAGSGDSSALTPEDMALLERAAAEAEAAGAESAPRGRNRRSTKPGREAPRQEVSNAAGVDLPEFAAPPAQSVSADRITMLNDVNLNVKIELGRTRMLVEDVLKLDAGSVVELDKLAGDPVDVFANDRLIARGEVLVLNDSFCVRISEVFGGDPHRIV